jgi:general secretion pathway protein J
MNTPIQPDADSHEAGFTLVEALVATALLAMVLLFVFNGIDIGRRFWERTDRRAAATDEVGAVQAFLRDRIAQAYPALIVLPPYGYRIAFQGERNRLAFSTTLPNEAGPGGYYRTVLMQRDEKLIMAWRLERNEKDDLGPRDAVKEKVVLSDVRQLRFTYYGESGANSRAEWRNDWMNRPVLPKLVRIEVEFPPGDARIWPAQTIATHIDMDATCIFDPLTKNCRGR